MNNDATSTLIIVLIILILMSSFFSATETAFSSLNKIRLKNMANNGDKKAEITLSLEEKYSKLISTILIGNNIVNILASSLATVLFVDLLGDDYGVTASTVVMTILVLIFGEITPKTIAKKYPEKWALAVTTPIRVIMFILTPFVCIFELWNKLIDKIFKDDEDDSISTDELVTIVEEAQNDGDLEEHESDLIVAAIEFNDMDVKEILTPRVDVVAVDISWSLEKIETTFRENSFSRLPVYENTIDNVVGVLHEKDFYYLYYSKSAVSLRQIVKGIQYTSPQVKISNLLRQLQAAKTHMAVVLDEYGGTAGIITMEDILEELVGEIYDEHDEVIEYYNKLSDTSYEVICDVDIDDMFEYFGMELEEAYDFITASGWVIYELGEIPHIGQEFDYKNLHVTVIDADNRKVNKIRIDFVNSKEDEDNRK